MEKTANSPFVGKGGTAEGSKKHLHVRGEDLVPSVLIDSWEETPPRTWRRPKPREELQREVRNTSTYVEKTQSLAGHCTECQKHLHVRGEDFSEFAKKLLSEETPPRTWRRQTKSVLSNRPCRNTSTYVEKTAKAANQSKLKWKHLHVRGEDKHGVTITMSRVETPPRTWRRLSNAELIRIIAGNTSTYVEKTDQLLQ